MTDQTVDTVERRLDIADQALTNLEACDPAPPDTEAFSSAIDATRSSINSARAQLHAEADKEAGQ